jgi:hypothetical protein
VCIYTNKKVHFLYCKGTARTARKGRGVEVDRTVLILCTIADELFYVNLKGSEMESLNFDENVLEHRTMAEKGTFSIASENNCACA